MGGAARHDFEPDQCFSHMSPEKARNGQRYASSAVQLTQTRIWQRRCAIRREASAARCCRKISLEYYTDLTSALSSIEAKVDALNSTRPATVASASAGKFERAASPASDVSASASCASMASDAIADARAARDDDLETDDAQLGDATVVPSSNTAVVQPAVSAFTKWPQRTVLSFGDQDEHDLLDPKSASRRDPAALATAILSLMYRHVNPDKFVNIHSLVQARRNYHPALYALIQQVAKKYDINIRDTFSPFEFGAALAEMCARAADT